MVAVWLLYHCIISVVVQLQQLPYSRHLLVNLGKSSFSQKQFFGNSGWNWGGLGVSGRSARSIRRHSVELWQDLVLHGIRKSTFQHLTVNWNFNVLEMVFKTFHIVQGLSRTPLVFIPRYPTNIFPESISQKSKISRIGNLEIQKPRFTNRSPDFGIAFHGVSLFVPVFVNKMRPG